MTVTVTRLIDDGKQTLGALVAQNDNKILVCNVLELPWLGNKPEVSCIPKGEYPCKYTRSHRLSLAKGEDFYTYEILNVPGRSGIRIHSANKFHELRGCLALGNGTKDLDIDGELDIIHSGATILAFESFMQGKDFKLIIK